MNAQAHATVVTNWLNRLFPSPKIPLKHQNAYTLLIAVILSAQCTDERVNKISPLLFAKAATPKAMSAMPVEAIETIIRPCGLGPTKAKAICKLSQILIEQHGGKVPSTLAELEALPGVGHKTASVMLVQAFHTPAFPVDTHIHRCAKRWHLSSGKSVVQTERDLKKVFPKKHWGNAHLQIIHYARKYCPARGHKVVDCPICFETQLV
ncbi:MAG: endonuclease III [Chlamydiota bacterium]